MKHRTREAIFNLISTDCAGRVVFDLFAGTGALGLEALSRGAASAVFIEKHVPSAHVVQANIRTLGVEDRGSLAITSAFLWAKRDLINTARERPQPWLVFCSPPYAFFHERQDEMVDLVERIQAEAPLGSILVVEADDTFDFKVLTDRAASTASWDLRSYAPALVGLWRN